jgi:hypothetical protein
MFFSPVVLYVDTYTSPHGVATSNANIEKNIFFFCLEVRETCSLKKHKGRIQIELFENRARRVIFGPKSEAEENWAP